MGAAAIIEDNRIQLQSALIPFQNVCKERGFPIRDLCLEEAYQGVSNASFKVNVTADWIDDLCRSDALSILIPILFETVDEPMRRKVFGVFVLDSRSDLKCTSEV